MKRVTVIDYRAGNIASVVQALRHLGAEVEIAGDDPVRIAAAKRIILPGVGHFSATARLHAAGVTPAVRNAIARGVPFLGICVGMQWLFAGSSEAPEHPGLGHFAESCARFPDGGEKVPHVGWNTIQPVADSRLFRGIDAGEHVYFTHSFRAPVTTDAAAVSTYIETFAAAVERGNVMGVQFHPEKSSTTGLRLLRNFLEWQPGAQAC